MINYLRAYLGTLIKNEKGQAMAEYGLILALIAVVVIVALTGLGTKIKGVFDNVKGSM